MGSPQTDTLIQNDRGNYEKVRSVEKEHRAQHFYSCFLLLKDVVPAVKQMVTKKT